MEIVLSSKGLRRLLLTVVAILAAVGLGWEIAEDFYGYSDPHDYVNFFSLSYEENLPTWFTATLIFTAALLLAVVASGKRGAGSFAAHWWVLALTLALISMDEITQLHEGLSGNFDFRGVLYFDWVIPAAIAVAIWFAAFIPFLLHLPVRTRNLFFLAGAIYVGGALVMELPLGWWTDNYGKSTLGYAVIDHIEEAMEMAGMSLFLYALVDYLAGASQVLRISFRGES